MLTEQLTKEQKELVSDNYPLARHFIGEMLKKSAIPGYLREDFISDVCLRFCIAALKYEEGHDCQFSTYAYGGCMIGMSKILGWTKKKFEKNRFVPSEYFDYFPDKNKMPTVRREELCFFLNVSDLTEKEKVILMDYYFGEENMKKVGEKYCLTSQAIGVIIQNSLRKLKRGMDRKNLTMEDF